MSASIDDANDKQQYKGAATGDGNDEPNVEVAKTGGGRSGATGSLAGRWWYIFRGARGSGAATTEMKS